jgi:hypothetical protein
MAPFGWWRKGIDLWGVATVGSKNTGFQTEGEEFLKSSGAIRVGSIN